MTDVDLSGPAPIGLEGGNGLEELPASPNAAAAVQPVDAARTGQDATQ